MCKSDDSVQLFIQREAVLELEGLEQEYRAGWCVCGGQLGRLARAQGSFQSVSSVLGLEVSNLCACSSGMEIVSSSLPVSLTCFQTNYGGLSSLGWMLRLECLI